MKLIGLFVLIFWLSCEEAPEFTNPLEEDPDPITEIIGDQDVFNSSTIILSWSGNEFSFEFSYMLEMEDYFSADSVIVMDWVSWIADTSAVLNYLDEGFYTFSVKSRLEEGSIESPIQSFSFEVDAVQGPALRIFQLKTSTSLNSTFEIYLWAEDVTELAGVEVALDFDADNLLPTGVVLGSLVTDYISTGGELIFPETEISNGRITFWTGVTNGDQSGLSGSGPLAVLTFQPLSSSSSEIIISDESILKDSDNNEIIIEMKIHGLVEVGE